MVSNYSIVALSSCVRGPLVGKHKPHPPAPELPVICTCQHAGTSGPDIRPLETVLVQASKRGVCRALLTFIDPGLVDREVGLLMGRLDGSFASGLCRGWTFQMIDSSFASSRSHES